MSEYSKAYFKDIAERTKKNLEKYQGEYDTTQLINSTVGLIIIPKEKCYNKIEDSLITQSLLNQLRANVTCNTYPEDGEIIALKNIIKHIRNGIAHGNIYFEPENRKIKRVIVKDHRREYRNEPKGIYKPKAYFEINIDESDLREFMIQFAEAIIKNNIITE